MEKSVNIAYLPRLDHLRAFAALIVLYYHSFQLLPQSAGGNLIEGWVHTKNPLLAMVVEGHTGVALFMVLSGFIFTWGANGREVAYFGFLRNRLLRIYPLYAWLLLVGIAMTPDAVDPAKILEMAVPFLNAGNKATYGVATSLFWTVAVEFQFYLIFPFLLSILNRQGCRQLALMILCAFVYRLIADQFGANSRAIAYWTIVGRIDQFLIGMIAAVALRRCNDTPQAALWLGRAFLPAILLMLTMITVFHRAGGYPVIATWKTVWPTVEAAGWALVIVTYLSVRISGSPALSRMTAYIGSISYSIYLTNFIVITQIGRYGDILKLMPNPHINALLVCTAVVLPASIALSTLTYFAIEQPFMKMRRKYMVEPQRPLRMAA
ncbi:acyltransferase family protein [Azospirillum melinis]|uniref:Acyltransferase family protein n=1 Tax=Azospirillum melinis TaxID=328839 RepID=A0ABX2KKV5_9PROT|nr:acyltransferase [Azospirillum melinis]MBP2309147.1 peptidoglycan/LPS O-acetylase OafA/YrhL [Azospirillum melinis]NUB03192.1 acyltransferase family protein [Azospirillum melinis]